MRVVLQWVHSLPTTNWPDWYFGRSTNGALRVHRSEFTLSMSDRRDRHEGVWRSHGERYGSGNIVQHDWFSGELAMLWGGISKVGCTELYRLGISTPTAIKYQDEIFGAIVRTMCPVLSSSWYVTMTSLMWRGYAGSSCRMKEMIPLICLSQRVLCCNSPSYRRGSGLAASLLPCFLPADLLPNLWWNSVFTAGFKPSLRPPI